MCEVLESEYIRTARAKGGVGKSGAFQACASQRDHSGSHDPGNGRCRIAWRSSVCGKCLRPAGIGTLAVQSVFNLDIPVIMGTVLFSATLVVIANLIVDVSYRWIDPDPVRVMSSPHDAGNVGNASAPRRNGTEAVPYSRNTEAAPERHGGRSLQSQYRRYCRERPPWRSFPGVCVRLLVEPIKTRTDGEPPMCGIFSPVVILLLCPVAALEAADRGVIKTAAPMSMAKLAAMVEAERAKWPTYDITPRAGDGRNLALGGEMGGASGHPRHAVPGSGGGGQLDRRLASMSYRLEYAIRQRFPHAPPIEFKSQTGNGCPWNYARGWISQFLLADQPDLILIYTHGDLDKLDLMLADIRRHSTADIVIPSLHLMGPDEDDPARWVETFSAGHNFEISAVRRCARNTASSLSRIAANWPNI